MLKRTLTEYYDNSHKYGNRCIFLDLFPKENYNPI